MTMVRLSAAQRAVLSDKLPDLANVVAAGLVVGQAFADSPSVWLLVTGFVVWVGLMVMATYLAEG